MNSPRQPGNVHSNMSTEPSGYTDGMRVLSMLIAGVLLYGGLGWLIDHFLRTTLFLPIGIILGMAGAIYMTVKRYGQVDSPSREKEKR